MGHHERRGGLRDAVPGRGLLGLRGGGGVLGSAGLVGEHPGGAGAGGAGGGREVRGGGGEVDGAEGGPRGHAGLPAAGEAVLLGAQLEY